MDSNKNEELNAFFFSCKRHQSTKTFDLVIQHSLPSTITAI